MNTLKWKRIYEPSEVSDGDRILVDQLWPRGVSKEKAALEEWAKPITPDKEIREAYHKGRMGYVEFAKKYSEELKNKQAFVEFANDLRERLEDRNVTLVFAGKTPSKTHLPTLREQLQRAGIDSESLPSD
ncbi:MAG: DUF488 family protein [Clostridiaceae bacterium]|jgi:uncharacterized protein YeaO (DUF488 family)|nr:DUF488 family protein [Clostridiaceae bacterium]